MTFNWRLQPHPGRESELSRAMFEGWHRGMLLGLQVESFQVDGVEVSEKSLERLNLWIEGSGAWRAATRSELEARAILDQVLNGRAGVDTYGRHIRNALAQSQGPSVEWKKAQRALRPRRRRRGKVTVAEGLKMFDDLDRELGMGRWAAAK